VARPSGHVQGSEGSVDIERYQQVLKRTLGPFQVFPISVALGILATYNEVLQGAGSVGIWLWVFVPVGHPPVALEYAQC
jgi:hypothetical protein